jgi:PTH1 family peptidyl-tRNA hydrolase
MWLIAGLGNPGKQYDKTRHNVGFDIVDKLADRAGVYSFSSQFKAEVAKADVGGERCLLIKPQTFMNLSGESVQGAMAFYKVRPENIVVIHDDMDIELGRIKLKKGGGHGGHNGIRDISARIGPEFFRVRAGVGRPAGPRSASSHVLGGWSSEEAKPAERLVEAAASAVDMLIAEGLLPAQGKFHTDEKKKKKKKGKNNKPKTDKKAAGAEGGDVEAKADDGEDAGAADA